MAERIGRFGTLELAGMGFAAGVSCGAALSLIGGTGDVMVPLSGAAGAVVLPILWNIVISPLVALVRRPVARRAAGHITA